MYMFLDSRRKQGYLDGSHVVTKTTCKFHIGKPKIWDSLVIRIFLTNSVGRMQIVQALLADRLATMLILHRERRADQ